MESQKLLFWFIAANQSSNTNYINDYNVYLIIMPELFFFSLLLLLCLFLSNGNPALFVRELLINFVLLSGSQASAEALPIMVTEKWYPWRRPVHVPWSDPCHLSWGQRSVSSAAFSITCVILELCCCVSVCCCFSTKFCLISEEEAASLAAHYSLIKSSN